MPETIRILLADDHALLRQGTAELLNREPDLEVVGEASNGLEAIDLASRLQPDVIVMDVRMPVLSGVEATRRIRSLLPKVQVLVLTAYDDDEYVFSLLQAGASGYLLKTAPVSELAKAIRQVRDGGAPLDPVIARKLVLRLSSERTSLAEADGKADGQELTPRELAVLKLLAQGLSNRSIGLSLTISDRTVQAHLTSIFAKMHVASRVEAILVAVRRGWLKLEQ